MRRLLVLHHRHAEWVPALQAAEPRLDIRGCHPRDAATLEEAWLAEAEGLFTWKIPPGFLARMPHLKWVQNGGAGVDHLCADRSVGPHVAITRADGQFGFWMARYVVAHLLSGVQHLEACRQAQAAGEWNPRLIPEDLTGRGAVVVGYGRIGQQIGRALEALGMDVAGVVRTARPGLHTLEEVGGLLPQARLLVLCAPLTVETRGLVDRRLLTQGHGRLMLINVGRGDLVEESALLEALDEGRLERAVLDVFPVEPLPTESRLWRHPKVTITPHHSGPSTPRAMVPDLVDNLRRFAEGRPLTGAVDRERGY